MKCERIGDRVYADTSGDGKGNVGAVELPNFTVVVDATISPETALAFRSSLEAQIRSSIQSLVITHYHADHTLGIPAFKGCNIIASQSYRNLRKTAKYQPTSTFEGKLVIEDEDYSLEIIHVGGHTADSSYVFFPQEKVLFSGDLIFAKTFFYGGDRTFNPEVWKAALEGFIELDCERIVPGHGPVCDKKEAEAYLNFFRTTSSTMQDLVQKGCRRREAVRSSDFAEFYPEYRKGVREQALGNWFDFYKRKTA